MDSNKPQGDNVGIRLNKYMAQKDLCSRREADELIKKGKVTINGVVEINPGTRINADTAVVAVAEDTNFHKKYVYIKLNKPAGYVVSSSPGEGKNVYELVTGVADIVPIGRLDKDSCGLLLFTNDSSLPKKIIGNDSDCEKEYAVKVNSHIPEGILDKLSKGINLWGTKTRPAKVRRTGTDSFNMVIREGKNRQIRRMCQKVGFTVILLKRIRIDNVILGNLPLGKWEFLTQDEVSKLKALKPSTNKDEY